jgi:8-oxo-dGTP pyrophosphatase MutT (NUDIX family)
MNSELYGNEYKIPDYLLKRINAKLMTAPANSGVKRAKNLVKNGSLTYQQMKRIKNFYENMDHERDKEQFELMGGEPMRKFIEKTLQSERSRTDLSKRVKEPLNVNLNDPTVKAQTGHVALTEEEDDGVNDVVNDGVKLTRNALVMIFDNEKRVLLLKRSSYPDQWMPNKWNLVGGGVEDGEEPIEAAKREAKEETGIEVDKLIEKLVIQRDDNNVEHLFIAKLPDRYDVYNVKLDKENDGYGWFKGDEIKSLDGVPNLKDYIRIAVTKYDE